MPQFRSLSTPWGLLITSARYHRSLISNHLTLVSLVTHSSLARIIAIENRTITVKGNSNFRRRSGGLSREAKLIRFRFGGIGSGHGHGSEYGRGSGFRIFFLDNIASHTDRRTEYEGRVNRLLPSARS